MSEQRKLAVPAEALPARRGSSYPKPFHEVCLEREKRTLGDYFGLKDFGVNLVTLAPTDRAWSGSLRVAELATRSGTLTYSDLGPAWAGWIAASAFSTDGFVRLARPEDRGPIDGPAYREHESASGRLTRSLSPGASLEIGARLYHESRSLGPPLDWAENDAGSLSVALDLVRRGGGTFPLRAFHNREQLEDSGGEPSDDRASQEPSNGSLWLTVIAGLVAAGYWLMRRVGQVAPPPRARRRS